MGNDKIVTSIEEAKGAGSSATGAANAAANRFFVLKLMDRAQNWVSENPIKSTVVIATVAPAVGNRVVVPAYDWAKEGIKGLFAKKVVDKAATEAKNAMSIGDVLGVIAGSIGKLK